MLRVLKPVFQKAIGRWGFGLLAALILFSIVTPWLSSHDASVSDFTNGANSLGEPVGPSLHYLAGADRIYRDLFLRLALGARLSLYIGIAASLLSVAFGALVGILAGFYEGTWLDTMLMRMVDVGLSFPFLLLVMAVGAALDQITPTAILLILGLTGWLSTARIVRSKTMQIRNEEYVMAARAMGASVLSILAKHILPNVQGTLFVLFALAAPQMIMADSVLSYLGVGISPPTPTLGYMLFEGQDVYAAYPWMLIGPAAIIVIAVLGFYLLSDALREVFDPKERAR